MEHRTFDSFVRRFGPRTTRRAALGSVAGLTDFVAGRRALAQESTPAASVDSSATDSPEFLFVQTFGSGAWQPADEDGLYTLTLTGTAAHTIYFADRPERIVGLVATDLFLDGLGFTPVNPPNAALVAATDDGQQDVLVLELFDPVYDANTATLTYQARVLADYGEPGLAHLAAQQVDTHLNETFAAGSLFIDGCPDFPVDCVLDDQVVGQTSVPQVVDRMNPTICVPTPQADSYCDNAFPDQCDGDCVARPTY